MGNQNHGYVQVSSLEEGGGRYLLAVQQMVKTYIEILRVMMELWRPCGLSFHCLIFDSEVD